jgi:Restriction endonuclease
METDAIGSVFFSRCRPQGSDPIDLVIRERRAFIGYPSWRHGVEPQRGHLREAIVDLRCSDDEWNALYPNFDNSQRKMYSQNRNFVWAIEVGAIALVPRPSRGVVYAGRVVRPFELLDDPPWGDEYLRLRETQGLDVDDVFSHLGDVVQCCEVDDFRPLPFPTIPAWVRRSLLGRSTFGHIHPLPVLGLDPYPTLSALLDNPRRAVRDWTRDIAEVERRLATSVGPNTFEHLCVALLQLEHPGEIWEHVGGSGDGGVDGVGADASDGGRVVGILQCKWAYGGESIAVADPAASGSVRQVLASLLHPPNVATLPGVEFWPRRKVAELVVRHAESLPLATSLRIGGILSDSLAARRIT